MAKLQRTRLWARRLGVARLIPVIFLSACVSTPTYTGEALPSASARQYETLKSAVDALFASRPMQPSLVGNSGAVLGNTAAASTDASQWSRGAIAFTGNLEFFDPDPSEKRTRGTEFDEELLRLAQTMGMLREQLRAAGYPNHVYEESVRRFERDSIQALSVGRTNPIYDDRAMDALVTRIDRVRAATYPGLPSVKYTPIAYASYVRPVILKSNPAGGRIWVITDLRFRVCKQTMTDPYDTNVCLPWREADAQHPMPLAGTYAYQVRWNNGRSARGQRTIYNDNSNSPIVYVLP